MGEVDRIDPDGSTVHMQGGTTRSYDVLIVATGVRLVPEETEGLTGLGWGETAFDFYTLEGATALRRRLASFEGGRIVVNPADMPIKCPVAPLEMVLLLEAWLTERGLRSRSEVVLDHATR